MDTKNLIAPAAESTLRIRSEELDALNLVCIDTRQICGHPEDLLQTEGSIG